MKQGLFPLWCCSFRERRILCVTSLRPCDIPRPPLIYSQEEPHLPLSTNPILKCNGITHGFSLTHREKVGLQQLNRGKIRFVWPMPWPCRAIQEPIDDGMPWVCKSRIEGDHPSFW